ncbi:glycosyltransferase [Oricola indica]|uniref:glycosyltransferase n=1 Tax=Oricola indica TaxID=2872591 RepID=UPI001CC187C2|nr:glycosyltransferase [Oricola indica]
MAGEKILSIVIPNFNGGSYLEELLSTLSTARNRSKFEIIFMDGGSQDNSVNIAELYLDDDDVIVSEPDGGQSDAIQKGLERAMGRWFVFQNSDDMFDIHTLDQFLDNSEQYSDFDVVAFDMSVKELIEGDWKVTYSFKHTRPISWRQLRYNIYYTNQATLYRTDLAKQVKFNPAFGFALDYDFVVRFFKTIKPRVKTVRGVLGYQRMHEATKTSNMQELCRKETTNIRRREYSAADALLGFFTMVHYHAFKKIGLG